MVPFCCVFVIEGREGKRDKPLEKPTVHSGDFQQFSKHSSSNHGQITVKKKFPCMFYVGFIAMISFLSYVPPRLPIPYRGGGGHMDMAANISAVVGRWASNTMSK